MPEFNFNGFDHIKPDDKLNQHLLQKITKKLNKKEPNMIPTKIWKFALAASLVVGLFTLPLFSGNRSFIDYAGFLSVYASEIEQPLLEIAQQEEVLDQAYLDGNLTKEEYDIAKEELRIKKEAIEEKKEELKIEFRIQDDLDLNEVTFNKDKAIDARLKELYTKQQEILQAEKELKKEQEKLDAAYKANQITLEDYIEKKQAVLSNDKELAKLEDRIEQINKSSYFSELDPKAKQEIQSIYKKKQEIDKEFRMMAQEEKKMLHDLSKNKLSYEDYITKKEGFIAAKKELAKLDDALLILEEKIIDGTNQEKDSNGTTTKNTTTVTSSHPTSASTATTLPNSKALDQERKRLEQQYRSHKISKEEYDEMMAEWNRLEHLLRDIEELKNKITTKSNKQTTTIVSKQTSVVTTKNSNANSNATKKNAKENTKKSKTN